jgi:hypothetical protein
MQGIASTRRSRGSNGVAWVARRSSRRPESGNERLTRLETKYLGADRLDSALDRMIDEVLRSMDGPVNDGPIARSGAAGKRSVA